MRTWDDVRTGFDMLPLFSEGESRIIRIVDEEHVMVIMKPTLYSFTHNRSGVFEGTDKARLEASAVLWGLLEDNGIKTGIVHVGADYYVSRRLIYGGREYVPNIEVVVKARHVGTPGHALYCLGQTETRHGTMIHDNEAHAPYVRFDWCNPLKDADGNRLKDECIPSGLAGYYIDTARAEQTALKAFTILHVHLSARGVRLDDICFKIDASGEVIFGEVSPDCMRSVHVGMADDFYSDNGHDISKDSFRKGSDATDTLARYNHFPALIRGPALRAPVALPGAGGRFLAA